MPTATTTSRDKFLDLLRRDILKLDRAELDFGIYRILNYRRDEIDAFLSKQLPARIEAVLTEKAGERGAELRERLSELKTKLSALANNTFGLESAFNGDALAKQLSATTQGKEYVKKQAELAKLSAAAAFDDSEEERLYNALYTFFARYYEDGDFLPQPRRGRDARFSVPYQGEDVHFSWRGRGSHYVKTSEQLRSYAFTSGRANVRFEFVSADLTQDNVKGDKRYLAPLLEPDITADRVTFYFAHRPLSQAEAERYAQTDAQEGLIADALAVLLPKLSGVSVEADALRKHMKRYARKNTEDYFVHPDLGAFLKSEFDYYLKNEYLNVDALTGAEAMSDRFLKFKALQAIGYDIITFLDQIESFQASLFEKRRFVLRSDYLAPMRLLSDELKEEAINNEAQVKAWRELFAVTGKVDKAFADSHPTLVVDTKHFDGEFKTKLLSLFDDLDEATDGLLVHAENYGALRTLQPKYAGKVKVIYIDPPYNTGNDGFLYKDDFSRHSTWLTMMEERLQLGRGLLADDGVLFSSIDDNEQGNLKELLDSVFGEENFVANVIWQKVFAPKNTAKHFSDDHEYLPTYAKHAETWRPYLLPRSEGADSRYTNPDNDPHGPWTSGDLTARNYYSEGKYEVTSPSGAKFKPAIGTYWRVSKEKFEELDKDKRIWWGEDGSNMPRLKRFLSEVKQGIVPQTLWKYEDVGHTQDAKKELLSIVHFERTEDVLNTVKPTKLLQRILHIGTTDEEPSTVLDFFAGSGSMAHAIIKQNAEDGGRRQFVLVEMGEYFDQMTFQRVIKAMYCPEWKNGSPASEPEFPLGGVYPDWVERSPRLVKVLRLESYEDSLNALELPQERSARAKGFQELFGDDYLLKYLLPTEVGDEAKVFLNTELLEKPFDYRLRLYTPEGPREQAVDLVETFNLLMGFHVKRISRLEHEGRSYVLVEAEDDSGAVLVVWRDIEGLDPAAERAFLESEFDLDTYHTVYANADIAVPKGQSLDREFKDRLLARVTGLLA